MSDKGGMARHGAPLSPAVGVDYAREVHGVSLTEDEAVWFTSEMQRSAGAAARAASGVALADVRMADFDALLSARRAQDE